MNNDLIKRYIYAVTCNLPLKTQPDVEKELESVIAELLDAHCEGREATIEDLKIVLTELGPPSLLASKYSGDEHKSLLSGIYLMWFKKLLKIAAPIAAFVVGLASVITVFIQGQAIGNVSDFAFSITGSMIGGMIEGAVQAFVCVFLVCFVLERKKTSFDGKDFLTKLRPVPPIGARIKPHEPILGICLNILAAVLFLGFPYLIGGYSAETGWVAAFDTSYIRSVWYLVIIWISLGITKEVFRLYERRYSQRLAIVSTIANLIIGTTAGVFFLNHKILNPAFAQNFELIFEESGKAAQNLSANINTIFFAIVIFALLIETGTFLYRSLRHNR